MFDLQPGIDLNECPVVAIGRHQELDRRQAAQSRRRRHPHRRIEQRGAGRFGQRVGGRPFDDLLPRALQRTFAIPQMADRAAAVADHLHLDMARARKQPFDIERIVAKAAQRLGGATGKGRVKLVAPFDRAHPATAATGDRLQHHRAAGAQRIEKGTDLFQRRRPLRPVGRGHVARRGMRARRALVAEQLQRFRRGTDERDPRIGTGPCERRIFGQEAIAGMDRVRPGLPRGVDHRVDRQIGGGPGTRQFDRLVRLIDMQRCRIVGGIDGDRGDPRFGCRAHDADGNFAAIGDQQLVHGTSIVSGIAPITSS